MRKSKRPESSEVDDNEDTMNTGESIVEDPQDSGAPEYVAEDSVRRGRRTDTTMSDEAVNPIEPTVSYSEESDAHSSENDDSDAHLPTRRGTGLVGQPPIPLSSPSPPIKPQRPRRPGAYEADDDYDPMQDRPTRRSRSGGSGRRSGGGNPKKTPRTPASKSSKKKRLTEGERLSREMKKLEDEASEAQERKKKAEQSEMQEVRPAVEEHQELGEAEIEEQKHQESAAERQDTAEQFENEQSAEQLETDQSVDTERQEKDDEEKRRREEIEEEMVDYEYEAFEDSQPAEHFKTDQSEDDEDHVEQREATEEFEEPDEQFEDREESDEYLAFRLQFQAYQEEEDAPGQVAQGRFHRENQDRTRQQQEEDVVDAFIRSFESTTASEPPEPQSPGEWEEIDRDSDVSRVNWSYSREGSSDSMEDPDNKANGQTSRRGTENAHQSSPRSHPIPDDLDYPNRDQDEERQKKSNSPTPRLKVSLYKCRRKLTIAQLLDAYRSFEAVMDVLRSNSNEIFVSKLMNGIGMNELWFDYSLRRFFVEDPPKKVLNPLLCNTAKCLWWSTEDRVWTADLRDPTLVHKLHKNQENVILELWKKLCLETSSEPSSGDSNGTSKCHSASPRKTARDVGVSSRATSDKTSSNIPSTSSNIPSTSSSLPSTSSMPTSLPVKSSNEHSDDVRPSQRRGPEEMLATTTSKPPSRHHASTREEALGPNIPKQFADKTTSKTISKESRSSHSLSVKPFESKAPSSQQRESTDKATPRSISKESSVKPSESEPTGTDLHLSATSSKSPMKRPLSFKDAEPVATGSTPKKPKDVISSASEVKNPITTSPLKRQREKPEDVEPTAKRRNDPSGDSTPSKVPSSSHDPKFALPRTSQTPTEDSNPSLPSTSRSLSKDSTSPVKALLNIAKLLWSSKEVHDWVYGHNDTLTFRDFPEKAAQLQEDLQNLRHFFRRNPNYSRLMGNCPTGPVSRRIQSRLSDDENRRTRYPHPWRIQEETREILWRMESAGDSEDQGQLVSELVDLLDSPEERAKVSTWVFPLLETLCFILTAKTLDLKDHRKYRPSNSETFKIEDADLRGLLKGLVSLASMFYNLNVELEEKSCLKVVINFTGFPAALVHMNQNIFVKLAEIYANSGLDALFNRATRRGKRVWSLFSFVSDSLPRLLAEYCETPLEDIEKTRNQMEEILQGQKVAEGFCQESLSSWYRRLDEMGKLKRIRGCVSKVWRGETAEIMRYSSTKEKAYQDELRPELNKEEQEERQKILRVLQWRDRRDIINRIQNYSFSTSRLSSSKFSE